MVWSIAGGAGGEVWGRLMKRRRASCAGGVYGARLLPRVSSSNTFSIAEL